MKAVFSLRFAFLKKDTNSNNSNAVIFKDYNVSHRSKHTPKSKNTFFRLPWYHNAQLGEKTVKTYISAAIKAI